MRFPAALQFVQNLRGIADLTQLIRSGSGVTGRITHLIRSRLTLLRGYFMTAVYMIAAFVAVFAILNLLEKGSLD